MTLNLDKLSSSEGMVMDLLRDSKIDFNNLNNEEFGIIAKIVDELRQQGDSSLLRELYEIDYAHPPPSIEEFCESDYFLGRVCAADEASGNFGLYNYWRDALYEAFSEPNRVNQLIFGGAIGLGKTTVGCVAMLYQMAHLLCLRDPIFYYQQMRGASLVFSVFSVTQKQIQRGAFKQALDMMRSSEFFDSRIPDNLNNKKFSNRVLELANNVILEAGSGAHEALGRNTIGSLVDEVNFRREKEAAEAAEELISSIDRRMKSRFATKGDNNAAPGLLIIASSAKDSSDFLNQHIAKNRNDPKTRIYESAWWDVVGPYRKTYGGETFLVDVGNVAIAPSIMDDEEEAKKIENRIIRVPIEHRNEFETDLTKSIQDIAGVSTGRQSKFLPSAISLFNCLRDDLENPLETETIKLSTNSSHDIKDSVNTKRLLQIRGNLYIPRRHPDAPRFIHMDMSTGAMDAMGFAMCHPVGIKDMEEFDYITGKRVQLTKPVFELDMAFRIVREDSQKPIDFGKVRAFIYWLHQMRFPIELVTADLLHLSTETLSNLEQLGFKTRYLSLDRKANHNARKGPAGGYFSFRQCIFEERFHTFDHDWFMLEALNLECDGDKVDHPKKWSIKPHGFQPGTDIASKDVTDAVAGCVYTAEQSDSSYISAEQTSPVRQLMASPRHTHLQGAPRDTVPTL